MKKRKYFLLLPMLLLLFLASCTAQYNVTQKHEMTETAVIEAESEQDKEEQATQTVDLSLEIKPNDDIEPGLYWENELITVYSGAGYYPRMYALSDGTLLCAFDTGENGGYIAMVRSLDNGLTWSDKIRVSEVLEMGCANPAIAELPSGELLVAYRANIQREDGYYSSVRVSVSNDNGFTWEPHSMIAEEFGTGGVYEPHFGWVGDKLLVFYANDSRNAVTKHMEQNIEFKIWQDGSWSEKYIASDGTKTHSRDGMPVWDLMEDGRYVLVVEATNEDGYPFVVQMKTSPDGMDWSEELRNIYVPYGKGRKAGAPYVTTLPDGRLAVAFQTDDEALRAGDDVSYMKVMVSKDKDGYIFSEPIVPFSVPSDRSSVWNGMYVHNGYLFAATGANYPKSGVFIRRAAIEPTTEIGQNVVLNSDFRFQNTQNWYIDFNGKIYHSEFPSKKFENKAGNYSLVLINNKGLDMSLTQEIMGVQEGSYTFRMKAAAPEGQIVKVILTQGSENIELSFSPTEELEVLEQSGILMQSGAAVLSVVMVGGETRTLKLDDIQLVRDK